MTPIDLITTAIAAACDPPSRGKRRRVGRHELRAGNGIDGIPGSRPVVEKMFTALESESVTFGDTTVSSEWFTHQPRLDLVSGIPTLSVRNGAMTARVKPDGVDVGFAGIPLAIRHRADLSDTCHTLGELLSGREFLLPSETDRRLSFPGRNVMPTVKMHAGRIMLMWSPFGNIRQGRLNAQLCGVYITRQEIEVDVTWKMLGIDWAKNPKYLVLGEEA